MHAAVYDSIENKIIIIKKWDSGSSYLLFW